MDKKIIEGNIKTMKRSIGMRQLSSRKYTEKITANRAKMNKLRVEIDKTDVKMQRNNIKIDKANDELAKNIMKLSFRKYKISEFKLIDNYKIDGTCIAIRTKDIKMLRKSIGKYTCKVDFADNISLKIVSDMPVLGRYDHPHVNNTIPCLGSYAGMYEQIRKEFKKNGFNKQTLYKLLMFLQKYLQEYNGESPHINYNSFMKERLKEKNKIAKGQQPTRRQEDTVPATNAEYRTIGGLNFDTTT